MSVRSSHWRNSLRRRPVRIKSDCTDVWAEGRGRLSNGVGRESLQLDTQFGGSDHTLGPNFILMTFMYKEFKQQKQTNKQKIPVVRHGATINITVNSSHFHAKRGLLNHANSWPWPRSMRYKNAQLVSFPSLSKNIPKYSSLLRKNFSWS